MSSAIVNTLKLATTKCSIYGGFFIFFTGMIGNILNIIIFTSLKTFRETSAAFYLTATSTVNICQLVAGLLSRILITGYNIDLRKNSSSICKIRQFTYIATMLIAFTYMCFAAIDQFLSLTNRWRHLCNTKLARRIVIFGFIICVLHGIPVFFFYNVYSPLGTGQTSCAITDTIYSNYYYKFLFPVLLGFLPLVIRIIFGLLAFINVRRLHNHQIPIVRLERDKQLTAMVLVEVVVAVFITLPYIIYYYLYSNLMTFPDPISNAQDQLITEMTRIIYLGNFAVSFYIYYCVSSRFRRQLAYVVFHIHLKCWHDRINRMRNNQIVPPAITGINVVNH